MKDLLVVIASQDYNQANHKGLWEELAKHTEVLVINIPADYLCTILTKKTYRISDARSGIKKISDNLSVLRPLLPLRLEVTPDVFFPWMIKRFWKQIEKHYNDLSSRSIKLLVYDGRWVKALHNSKDNIKIGYYLFDEVRQNGFDGSQDAIRTKYDDYACTYSDFILTMTEKLALNRDKYDTPKIVIGNGAKQPAKKEEKGIHIHRSVAFIGNIRDWIDKDMLTELIQIKPDCLFAFVGPVEENMKAYVENLTNQHLNVAYFGIVNKEWITDVYKMFDAVIIPYKNNDFVKSTRPIKIVESVLAGTPVVTVPIDGYDEKPFIRFADNAEAFSQQLDIIFNNQVIQENCEEYSIFVSENTWEKKALKILNLFDEDRRKA